MWFLRFAFTFLSEENVKGLSGATLAPKSSQYFMVASKIGLNLSKELAPEIETMISSASTLGWAFISFIIRTHGLIRKAMKFMDSGQPCGMLHGLW